MRIALLSCLLTNPLALEKNESGRIRYRWKVAGKASEPNTTLFAANAQWRQGVHCAEGTYLADKTGQLIPSDAAARYQTLQWLMFQMASVGPMFGQVGFFVKFAGKDLLLTGIGRINPAQDRAAL